MQNLSWFETLALTVTRRLPASHVERVLGELSDHFDDSGAPAGSSPAAVLGDADVIASRFVDEFRGRTVFGQHPWVSMLVVPLPGPPLILFAPVIFCVLFFIGLLPALGIDFINREHPGELSFAVFTGSVLLLGPMSFAVATAVTVWVWNKAARGTWWMLGAMALQVLTSAMTVSDVALTPGRKNAGFHWGTECFETGSPLLFDRVPAQIAVTLLTCVAIVMRQRKQTGVLFLTGKS